MLYRTSESMTPRVQLKTFPVPTTLGANLFQNFIKYRDSIVILHGYLWHRLSKIFLEATFFTSLLLLVVSLWFPKSSSFQNTPRTMPSHDHIILCYSSMTLLVQLMTSPLKLFQEPTFLIMLWHPIASIMTTIFLFYDIFPIETMVLPEATLFTYIWHLDAI